MPEAEKMNGEVKRLWLEELRSGRYEQGMERLRDGHSYCCLGVLCDIYARETGEGYWEGKTFISGDHEGTAWLTPEVTMWAGLRGFDGVLPEPVAIPYGDSGLSYTYHTLAALNDESGMDFLQIADVIEEQF